MSLCRLKISKMYKIYETVFLCYSAIILITNCSCTVADPHPLPRTKISLISLFLSENVKKSDKIISWELYGIINHTTERENKEGKINVVGEIYIET